MVAVHVLRVFTDPKGRWGNPLAVFLDGAAITEQMRLAVAAELGYSETVFVEDVNRAEIRIFSPESEFAFAGHPLVDGYEAWQVNGPGTVPARLPCPAAVRSPSVHDAQRQSTGSREPEGASGAGHLPKPIRLGISL